MTQQTICSWWFARRLAYLAAATVLFAGVLGVVMARAAGSDRPGWAAPDATAIRRTGPISSIPDSPYFLNNLDCSPVTYRLVASDTMQTGCFTETALGLMEAGNDIIIFNGTDEGLPLLPYMPHQALVPWPKTMDLVSLNPLSTGGWLMGLYKNPLGVIKDDHNALSQLTAKELIAPPDMTLKDASGAPLVINPQTLAFSDGGGWLVAETLSGSFVRVNLATLAVTAFAPSYGSQGSPGALKSRVAVSEDGDFVAIATDAATEFKVYDLATCDDVVHDSRPQSCQSHDYWPFARQHVSGLRSVGRVRFINDGLLSFEGVSSDAANSGTYELAPASSITSLTDYIGLGDSYTSGEGAFDYLDGTDTPDDMCHLSRVSYPLLLTDDLFGHGGGHSVACSGAVINDVGSTSGSYRGQVRGVADLQQLQQSQPLLLESVEANFIPGYVAQQRFVKRWQPGVATVSVGGDDIGFGNLVQNCVEPHLSRHLSDNTCYASYEDRLELKRLVDRTVPRWTALYGQLRREAPDTQLYVIGYPQIAVDNGSCALNVHLNKSELEFAAEMIDYLNKDIQKAAVAAGVPYVDISQALAGHRLCETASYSVAVNGLTAGTDAGPLGTKIFGKESYHPNALGQSLIEQAILKQTHNLAGVPAAGGSDDGGSTDLLDAPKSGQTVYTLVPDNGLTSGVGKRGMGIAVQAAGVNDGLRPNSTYSIHLDGPAGDTIGGLTSDGAGDISGSAAIPDDTAPGGHAIDVTGENQDGEPVDVTQPIYVTGSDTDSDDDGIDDMVDSCPGAANSGQDADGDGVDDTCDRLIGAAGSGPDSAGGQGGDGDGTVQDSIAGRLISGTETVVASFAANQVTPPTAGGGPMAAPGGVSGAHVLGAVSNGPGGTGKHSARPGSDSPDSRAGRHTKRGDTVLLIPRTVYLLSWLLPAIMAGLLLYGMEKRIQTTRFRLQ